MKFSTQMSKVMVMEKREAEVSWMTSEKGKSGRGRRVHVLKGMDLKKATR